MKTVVSVQPTGCEDMQSNDGPMAMGSPLLKAVRDSFGIRVRCGLLRA